MPCLVSASGDGRGPRREEGGKGSEGARGGNTSQGSGPQPQGGGSRVLGAGERRDPLGGRACVCPPKFRPQSLSTSSVLFGLSPSPIGHPQGRFIFLALLGHIWLLPHFPKGNQGKAGLFQEKDIFTWKLSYR